MSAHPFTPGPIEGTVVCTRCGALVMDTLRGKHQDGHVNHDLNQTSIEGAA
jgi:hypothetical protein